MQSVHPSPDEPRRPRPLAARLLADPRHFQIAALAVLLAWGVSRLGFAVAPAQIGLTLGGALAAQWTLTRLLGAGPLEPRSALITGLSLCLLLRVDHLALAGAAAILAIASKFLVRVDGAHVFNPACVAIATLVLLCDAAWVSPGQWGRPVIGALAFAGLGLLVLTRARRLDVMLAFLGAWAAFLLARALWLGDPLAIPIHQLENGALLLFAFFMLPDPRTTPRTRAGRVVFALTLAAVGAWITFGLHRPDGLILALAACAPLVPLVDRWLPGPRHAWSPPPAPLSPVVLQPRSQR